MNKDKHEIGLKDILFHGKVITKDGVKIDDTKVKAISDMQLPTDVSGVKRLWHGSIHDKIPSRPFNDTGTTQGTDLQG